MKNNTEIQQIIQNLSDTELLQIISECKQPSIDEDALIKKIVIEVFGGIDILLLQIQKLLWYILEEIVNRFKVLKEYTIQYNKK